MKLTQMFSIFTLFLFGLFMSETNTVDAYSPDANFRSIRNVNKASSSSDNLDSVSSFIWNHTGTNVVQDSSYNDSSHAKHFRRKRIVNGIETRCNDFPYQAQFMFNFARPDGKKGSGFCSGVLVSPSTVITAAICCNPLYGFSITSAYVVLGALTVKNEPLDEPCYSQIQKIPVDPKSIYAHEDYNQPLMKNDICSLTLDRCATIGFRTKPIILAPPRSDENTRYGEVLQSSGWGLTDCKDDLTKLSNRLLYTNSIIVEPAKCSSKYGNFFDPVNMNCLVSTGIDNACALGNRGDLGNPLTWCVRDHLELVGIMIRYDTYPFRQGKCDICSPTVFLRISQYYDWIMGRIEVGTAARGCVSNIYTKCPAYSCREWCEDQQCLRSAYDEL